MDRLDEVVARLAPAADHPAACEPRPVRFPMSGARAWRGAFKPTGWPRAIPAGPATAWPLQPNPVAIAAAARSASAATVAVGLAVPVVGKRPPPAK